MNNYNFIEKIHKSTNSTYFTALSKKRGNKVVIQKSKTHQ